jgi:hypothetical protein
VETTFFLLRQSDQRKLLSQLRKRVEAGKLEANSEKSSKEKNIYYFFLLTVVFKVFNSD